MKPSACPPPSDNYRFSVRHVNGFPVAQISDNLYRQVMGEITLQDRLREARKRAGLSQSAVASAVGIAQGTYSDLERIKGSGSKHIVAIARVLGVTPDWLLTGTGEEESAASASRAAQREEVYAIVESMSDADLKTFLAAALQILPASDRLEILADALRDLRDDVSAERT
jgi:transcriptional regulator with XRE-family HTH domain